MNKFRDENLLFKMDHLFGNESLLEQEPKLIEELILSSVEGLDALSNEDKLCFWEDISFRFEERKQLQHAIYFLLIAISFQINNCELIRKLAFLYLQTNNIGEAIAYYENVLLKNPTALDYFFLGNAYEVNRDDQRALKQYMRVIELEPQAEYAYFHIAKIHFVNFKYIESAKYYLKALQLAPANCIYKDNYARVLCTIGRVSEAVNLLREVVMQEGFNEWGGHSDLLFMQNHDFNSTRKEMLDVAESFKNFTYKKIGYENVDIYKDVSTRRLQLSPDKLRLAFVFPFVDSTVAAFFLKLLKGSNRKRFEYFCYNTVGDDYVSLAIQRSVDKWANISAMTDSQAAALIVDDEVDILVDMRIHVAGNRSELLAYRAAPIQIGYYDYIDPVGLPQLDYIVAHSAYESACAEDPREAKLLSLNVFPMYFPAPESLPEDLTCAGSLLEDDSIIFASLNRFEKINSRVLELWARILARVPNSKMLFQASVFVDEDMITFVQNFFAENGVNKDRLIFQTSQSMAGFLQTVRSVDLTLSPYPFPGVTTTFHTLSQGVPVVVLNSDQHKASKAAVSLLKDLALEEFIANSEEEYLQKAIYFADKALLKKYKALIQERIANARFLRPELFQAEFERALEEVWFKHKKQNEGVLSK
jgi:predicted O-linked N-acetylglucosamine transferase (SPINDLY family)